MKFILTASFVTIFLISCAESGYLTRFSAQGGNNTSGEFKQDGGGKDPFGKPDQGQEGCVGQVYALPAGTKYLPTNFDSMEPLSTIVAGNFNVPVRSFEEGFPGIPGLFEWFAIRYRCIILAPVSSPYTFKLNSDDGTKLFIDGKLVIDNDGTHPPTTKSGTVDLTSGKHYFELQYFQGPRYHIALELFWKYLGLLEYEIIPEKYFFRWN